MDLELTNQIASFNLAMKYIRADHAILSSECWLNYPFDFLDELQLNDFDPIHVAL